MGLKPFKPQTPWSPFPHPQKNKACKATMPQNHTNSVFSLFFPIFPSDARLFPGCGAAPGAVSKLLPAFPAFSHPTPIPCQHLDTKDPCEAFSSCSRFFPAGKNTRIPLGWAPSSDTNPNGFNPALALFSLLVHSNDQRDS